MIKDNLTHYFKDGPNELSNRKEITFRFLAIDYIFESADNVFSKDHVDLGSQLLMKSALDYGFESNVLDYGCGYGVVGIIMAKLAYKTFGVDVTSRAIKLSKINAKKNNVKFPVEIIDDNLSKYYNKFNTVLLNPPIRAGKEVIYSMFENTYKFLNNGGKLFVVIRKQHGANSAIKKLEEIYSNVKVIEKKKGYYVIVSEKFDNLTQA